MIADGDLIALFNSPTKVMKAEKLLRQGGFSCRLIPAPRQVAEGCALALRFTATEQTAVFKGLTAASAPCPPEPFGSARNCSIRQRTSTHYSAPCTASSAPNQPYRP